MGNSNTTQKKTKVLYVVESFSTGVYAIVRDIACNLDPERFELLILHSLRDDSPKHPEKDFMKGHITLQYLPMGSAKQYVAAVRSIRKIIKTFQPDCIHLHSSKAGFLGRLAAKGLCRHVLYSPHGFSFLRTDVGTLKRGIFFGLEYWINRYLPSKIVAVSEGEKEHAVKITKDAIVINNFIDIKSFRTVNREESNTIVTCGRITSARNPTLFNTIATALPEQKFIWIGDGPLRSSINAPNITVTGFIPRQDAIGLVQQTSIYIQTSLWEGMPVAVLEAMAAGKPIVASKIIGNKDLIQDGTNGFLCDSSSSDEFISRIKELISSESLRISLGRQAREFVEDFHDLHTAISSYEILYQNC